jgi:guanylate kinase
MSTIYIISAPSGAGKTSLVKGLCNSLTFIKPSVSYTTRKVRESEVDGKDYFFVSRENFEEKISNNDFLEYQDVYGNMYGSTLKSVNTITSLGSDVVLEIDYKGMLAVKRELPHAMSIYITPPNIETLKERLLKRGEDTEEVINKRMASASNEMAYAKYADYEVINDNYDDALNILKGIILLNRIDHRQLSGWANYLNKINNCIV